MVHGEKLACDELQVGDGAVRQHHEHLVRGQAAADRAAPNAGETQERSEARSAPKTAVP